MIELVYASGLTLFMNLALCQTAANIANRRRVSIGEFLFFSSRRDSSTLEEDKKLHISLGVGLTLLLTPQDPSSV